MRQVTIVARTKAEYEGLLTVPVIEKPVNQHWARYVPPQLVVIGDNMAVIPELMEVVIRREGHYAVRPVRVAYFIKDERKIQFYLKAVSYETPKKD